MNKNGVIILVVIIVLIILAIIGFASFSAPNTTVAPTTDTQNQATDQNGVPIPLPGTITTNSTTTSTTTINTPPTPQPVKTFTVHGGSFYFAPSSMTVNEGDKVVINFVDDGGTHNFYLDEFNVKSNTLNNAGDTTSVSFTADKKGSFEYYCAIGTHRQMGMRGTLTVN